MRAFSFDKEPAFKSMEATSIWGELISAGGSLAGGLLGGSGAGKANKIQEEATKRQLALQDRAYEDLKGYLDPYVSRGGKADGYLDALLYGEGEYGGYMSGGGGVDRQAAAREYARLNPQALKNAQAEVSNRRSQYFGYDPIDFLAKQIEGDPYAESLGQQAAPGTKVTRDEAFKNLQKTLPWQFNEGDLATRTKYNNQDFANRERLNEEDYLKAQGFTDAEIAAWVDNARAEQDKSIDALFNRGGLTGQVGATRRGVAQVGEEFSRDRAMYEAERRRADYDPYAQRRAGNYETWAAGRGRNYDDYSAGRLSAYGGYLDMLGRDSDRGYQAGSGIASGGQVFANTAGRLIGDGARTQAGYVQESSDRWGRALQGAAGYLSDAWNQRGRTGGSGSHTGAIRDPDHETPSYTAPRTRRQAQPDMYAGVYN